MTAPLPQVERRLLNFALAAAYLGISVRAMKELGGPDGKIVRVQIGHRILFDRADLDRFIDTVKKSA